MMSLVDYSKELYSAKLKEIEKNKSFIETGVKTAIGELEKLEE